jgi:hypothetical protein
MRRVVIVFIERVGQHTDGSSTYTHRTATDHPTVGLTRFAGQRDYAA